MHAAADSYRDAEGVQERLPRGGFTDRGGARRAVEKRAWEIPKSAGVIGKAVAGLPVKKGEWCFGATGTRRQQLDAKLFRTLICRCGQGP